MFPCRGRTGDEAGRRGQGGDRTPARGGGLGWSVQTVEGANPHAARGVAIREFPLKDGHGFADYLLYVDAKAAGVLEAKKQGFTLSGVETQSDMYVKGLPEGLPA